ncbi:MAG TPA: site-2 protease family protein [Polyangiaceae bacterium]|nr:site-2 protease family protein [Polyangiaceae bacterium]
MANDPSVGFPAPLGAPPRYEQPEPPRFSSAPPQPRKPRFWLHFVLFGLTLLSMQVTAMNLNGSEPGHWRVGYAAYQALSLIGILLVHELGHYIAARLHRVPASPPYFLPLPLVGLFGTLGAVITMSGRIRSRKALLDIGAAGPIAGMVVALPVLYFGLRMSEVGPRSPHGLQEGQSLLYWAMKRLVFGPIQADQDVQLHPMAFAGWGGLCLTMINLLPWGQLDGGHIAFALFGERQHVFARWFRRGLLLAFAYNFYLFVLPVLLHKSTQTLGEAFGNSVFWLMWYGITGLMARVSGEEHPPFEPGPLGRGRQILAVGCLVLFVLLFLPTPLTIY